MRHPRSGHHHEHHDTPSPETALEEWTEAKTGQEPHIAREVVDVRVVEAVHVEDFPARTIITTRSAVGSTISVQLHPRLRTRAALHIRPVGGTIYLANSSAVTVGTGYALPDGQALRIEATDAVYAIAAGPVDVSILAEVREG